MVVKYGDESHGTIRKTNRDYKDDIPQNHHISSLKLQNITSNHIIVVQKSPQKVTITYIPIGKITIIYHKNQTSM